MPIIEQPFVLVQGGRVPHAYPLCQSRPAYSHCEEHRDTAISMRLNKRRPTITATTTRLPRYARNDKGGRARGVGCSRLPPLSIQTCLLPLRGAPAHPELVEGRGNLDDVAQTPANHPCCCDEIATLRSQ